jgi:uncharacterized protein
VSSVARDPRLDALRGFALLGILWVNIQSYVYGATNPIGFLAANAGFLDRLAYFLTAAFVAGKFMPLFGMLFGASFALLYGRLRSSAANPRDIYRRRLVALFVIGMLHGLFLYFGEITHAYAVAGFVLLLYADSDVAATARATVRWWLIAGIWTVLLALPSIVTPPEVTAELVDELNLNVAATVSLGYWEQWPIRAEMFIWQLQANLLSLPVLIALMLTGILAQRSGWLADLRSPAWTIAARIGALVGVPTGVAYGLWSVTHAELAANLQMPAALMIVLTASLTLAFLYAAAFLRRAPDSLVRLLAPAGRMALSNYVLQSVVMGAVLSGWGLALGDTLAYAQLSALACMVFVVQLVASRWWLKVFRQGPLEALWRAWTYRGLGSGAR